MEYLLSVLPLLGLICGSSMSLVIFIVALKLGWVDRFVEWLDKRAG